MPRWRSWPRGAAAPAPRRSWPTPWQMYAWGLVGYVGGLLGRCGLLGRPLGRTCWGVLSRLVYGVLLNGYYVLGYVRPLTCRRSSRLLRWACRSTFCTASPPPGFSHSSGTRGDVPPDASSQSTTFAGSQVILAGNSLISVVCPMPSAPGRRCPLARHPRPSRACERRPPRRCRDGRLRARGSEGRSCLPRRPPTPPGP